MELLYVDKDIVVCIKPARVLSTDEPGGLPDLVREALGKPNGDIRTVHRLDRVVSGLMVLARNAEAASELSRPLQNCPARFGKMNLKRNILRFFTAVPLSVKAPCRICFTATKPDE